MGSIRVGLSNDTSAPVSIRACRRFAEPSAKVTRTAVLRFELLGTFLGTLALSMPKWFSLTGISVEPSVPFMVVMYVGVAV